MERLRVIWYRLVAPRLFRHLYEVIEIATDLKQRLKTSDEEINKLKLDLLTAKEDAKIWQQRALTENKDAAIAVQVIKERIRSENPCVFTAHERASKVRIRELESEVARLQHRVRDSESEVSYLRSSLSDAREGENRNR